MTSDNRNSYKILHDLVQLFKYYFKSKVLISYIFSGIFTHFQYWYGYQPKTLTDNQEEANLELINSYQQLLIESIEPTSPLMQYGVLIKMREMEWKNQPLHTHTYSLVQFKSVDTDYIFSL